MPRILATDRLLIVGSSGFGKSTLAAYLFSQMIGGGAQHIVVDPKGEWIVPGATVSRTPEQLAAALDKGIVSLHYVPSVGDKDEWIAVYELLSPASGRRAIVVWTDEAQNVCVSGANWAPRGIVLIQTQGRGHGIPHIVCSTRPCDIERTLRTEAVHVFVMAGGLDYDDLKVLVGLFRVARDASGRPFIQDADDLQGVLAQIPEYGYAWLDRRLRKVQICPPLPEHYRRAGAAIARQRRAA